MQVLIAERHPLFRERLRMLVQDAVGPCESVEAADFTAALAAVQDMEKLRLVLLDLTIDGMDGIMGLVRLSLAARSAVILVVCAAEEGAVIRQSLICGAAGYVPKSLPSPDVIDAIRRVLVGETFCPVPGGVGPGSRLDSLTARERTVLGLLVAGRSNKQIAFDLTVSDATVRAHVSAVLRKMGVQSRTQAVIAARRPVHW